MTLTPTTVYRRVSGLVPHQVLQRTTRQSAQVTVTGDGEPPESLVVNGAVVADVRRAATSWSAELTLIVGGPYTVEARWADGATTLVADDVLVGDVWLLAGQSNMQGCGRLDEPLEPTHPLVHVHDPQARWRPGEEPLHERGIAFGHTDPAEANGAGLGLAFGRDMVSRTGVPIGLVATAVGATSTDHWDPARTNALWARMLELTGAAGGRLAGVLWYQGESETDPGRQEGYAEALDGIAVAFRQQFGEDCRLVHVQIGRFLTGAWVAAADRRDDAWTQVRRVQAAATGWDAMVAAIDCDMTDFIHLSTAGLRRLGRRLAAVASGDRRPLSVTGIRLADAHADTVRIAVDGVVGRLRPDRPRGFTLHDARGGYLACAATVSAAAVIDVRLPRPLQPGDALHYGYGMDPVCDVVDEDDMPLPTAGPFPLA